MQIYKTPTVTVELTQEEFDIIEKALGASRESGAPALYEEFNWPDE